MLIIVTKADVRVCGFAIVFRILPK